MAHHHCNDFSRTELLRRTAERACDCVPEVVPGMPTPAGTGTDRRRFLLRSAGALVAVYGAGRLGLGPAALDDGIAAAAAGGADAPVLVSVFLAGGIDSLSVLAPVEDPVYRRARRTLALPPGSGTPFSEDPRLRWHPLAAPIAQLHAEGKVTVVPGIGYEGPDQSHFASRHYWEVGATDAGLRTGWLGRYLDRAGSADNPMQGLSLDGRMSPALAATRVPVAAIDRPDGYDFWARGVWGDVGDWMVEAFAELGSAHAGGRDAALAQAGTAAARAGRLRQQLEPFRGGSDTEPAYTSPVQYPSASNSKFPSKMAGLAAMLGAGLPMRCVTVTGPGDYDTHDTQKEDFEAGLGLTASTLLAFQRDLEARGLADRVLLHVWSEFGRRVEENGGRGTDHGAGGVSFLIGNRASGRMIGEFPGLGTLDDDGNLRSTADFRGLYCSVLEQWFGTDASAVIPGASGFARPQVVK